MKSASIIYELARPGLAWVVAGLLLVGRVVPGASVELDDPSTPAGYVALLLINEAPFPGERGYVSEDDSKAAMLSVLWVLHCRVAAIPPGYTQREVAAVTKFCQSSQPRPSAQPLLRLNSGPGIDRRGGLEGFIPGSQSAGTQQTPQRL